MSARDITSSSRTSSTSHRRTGSSYMTQTEYVTRSVVLSRGPNAVEPASLPASPGSASSHSFSPRNRGNAGPSAPSSAMRRPASAASSTSAGRSPHDPMDPRADRPAPSHSSSSHSRSRSGSIISTPTSSRQSDSRSSTTRASLMRGNTASAFIEPVPEESEPRVRSDETRNEHAIVPITRGAPAAGRTTGWRHTYHSQTGVLSVSASQTQRDTRGNTYVLNVVHNYPPPVISPPVVVPVIPVCCVPGNECEFHRRFRRF